MTAPQVLVALSWVAVFAGWLVQWRSAQRTRRSEEGRVVNPRARLGMLFEFGSFLTLALFAPESLPLIIQWIGSSLGVAGALLGYVAGRHLGKELRVQAVVSAEQRLVTSGPYSVVRHPIYLCLILFLTATALAWERASALLLALPLCVLGTEIRVRAEDALLAAHFGSHFEEYRRRVSAYVPGLR